MRTKPFPHPHRQAIPRNFRLPRAHASPQRPDPYYGYDYSPAWPSVLSIAHDENEGGTVLIYVDRPCVISGSYSDLPLTVEDGAGGDLVPLALAAISGTAFSVRLSGAAPLRALWRWGAGGGLIDPVSGHGMNVAHGTCADFPGPYTPPATVIATSANGTTTCDLIFNQAVTLAPGTVPDDAITLDGVAPVAVSQPDPYILRFEAASTIGSGSLWAIVRQPTWVESWLANPADGTFA